VIDTGNLDRAGSGTYVGLNCTWWDDNWQLTESDIRFNVTDEDFTYTPGSSTCDDNDYDVLSVMTHETGHTYGMKDKEDDINYYQTMFGTSFPCRSWARNLGRSDVKHLRSKYPE
jgi:hypothetical protein